VLSDEALMGRLQDAILAAQPLIQLLAPGADGAGASTAAGDAAYDSGGGSGGGSCAAGDGGGAQGTCSTSSAAGGSQPVATQDSVPVLLSGAGHDAMAVADLTKRIAMVFVRCRGGVSHNPAEYAAPTDVAAAAAALATFVEWDALATGAAVVDGAQAHA
jgi:hypothetical protein